MHCPNCGGELRIIAAILEPPVIEKILAHLGLDPQLPPKGRVREAGCTSLLELSDTYRHGLRLPCSRRWRCALRRQAMTNIRVNPETGPILRAVNVQRPANSPAPSLQTPRLRAESAQTCILRPSAGSASSLLGPFLGPSDSV